MILGALAWLILDLPLAWLLGPATVGLVLATKSLPIRQDLFFGDIGRGLLGVAIGASITHEHIDWMLDQMPSHRSFVQPGMVHKCQCAVQ